MNTYLPEFLEAMLRSQRLGLAVPPFRLQPERRWLTEKTIAEFPHVLREALGELSVDDVNKQCLSIHYRLQSTVGHWLGCGVFYTLGWVDDETDNGLFRTDESLLAAVLQGSHAGKMALKVYAWLTLPSMEIIDVTLFTTLGLRHQEPRMLRGLVTRHADELNGMQYKPLLAGDEFLRKANILQSVDFFSLAK